MAMLEVILGLQIPEAEFQWSFVRASGPGGQNVNKVASKAVLRWNVAGSPSVPATVKARFTALYRRRITAQGELVLSSQRFRDQERNRQDCFDKLSEMLRAAATPPRPRRPTRPSRGSREARLQDKRRRAGIKSIRRRPMDD
jgi:ribosome-associated protein